MSCPLVIINRGAIAPLAPLLPARLHTTYIQCAGMTLQLVRDDIPTVKII